MKVSKYVAGETVAEYEVTVDVMRSATFLFVQDINGGKIECFDIDAADWDAMIRQHEAARAMQREDPR